MNIFKGLFGLEKENMRVDKNGHYATSPHGQYFHANNPYITRDFSEAQLEMITRPHKSIKEALGELHNIQQIVIQELKDEYLWPQSNPPVLPQASEIQIAQMDEKSAIAYRQYLADKYGQKKESISGIHYNISVDESVINYFNIANDPDFSNQFYLKITKYFLKYEWFFTYIFAASPVFHNSYQTSCVLNAKANLHGDCVSENLISLRSSECGYKNISPLYLDYSSLFALNQSIQTYIDKGIIIGESEIYESIRVKKDVNISYLELRFIDINPYESLGISERSLAFIHLCLLYFASLEDFDFNQALQMQAYQRSIIINNFIQENISTQEALKHEGLHLINAIIAFSKKEAVRKDNPYDLEDYLQEIKKSFIDETQSLSYKLKMDIEQKGYVDFHLQQAKLFKKQVLSDPLDLRNYKGLELSTQILLQAAIKKGILFEVLDRKENIVKLQDPSSKHIEYVKQASKTNLDGYASVLMMENKAITKALLHEGGLNVPKSMTLYEPSLSEPISFEKYVIKPNNTNFGLGISILENVTSDVLKQRALELAFNYDDTVLVEEFIEGYEYRFLVLNKKCVAVLHRRAASVVGDGLHTIEALIAQKNLDPLRGKHYTRPLEKIEIDAIMNQYLQSQGRTLNDIPKEGERIVLRENSNISTGGDSVDMTLKMHPSYKVIAEKAADLLDVNICGVDIIIKNPYLACNPSNYSILEMNFNPALHIHAYPFEGEGVAVADLLISCLFPNMDS